MLKLTYDNKVFDYSENILKISTYLENIAKDRESVDEPLPLINCSESVFKIFNGWFKVIERTYIKDNEVYQIFNTKCFEFEDMKTLIDIFNFGFGSQIKLLCDTVACVIASKTKDIIEVEGKYYTLTKVPKIIDGVVYTETLLLHQSLAMMISKYLPNDLFYNLPINLRLSVNFNYKNVKDNYKFSNDYELVLHNDFPAGDKITLKALYEIWHEMIYQDDDLYFNETIERVLDYEFEDSIYLNRGEHTYKNHELIVYLDECYNKKYDELTYSQFVSMLDDEETDRMIKYANENYDLPGCKEYERENLTFDDI